MRVHVGIVGLLGALALACANPKLISTELNQDGDAWLVHWSAVEVRLRPTTTDADYPAEAESLSPEDRACTVRIYVDETGIPYDARPRNCAEVVTASAHSLGMRYRFYPVIVDGHPAKVAFDMTMRFLPPDPPK